MIIDTENHILHIDRWIRENAKLPPQTNQHTKHEKVIRENTEHWRRLKKIKEKERKGFQKRKHRLSDAEEIILENLLLVVEYYRLMNIYLYWMKQDKCRREFKWKENKKQLEKREMIQDSITSEEFYDKVFYYIKMKNK